MRNAEQYIEQRKQAIKAEKELNETKKGAHGLLNFANEFNKYFFGICGGLLLVGGMPGVGIAFISTAIANHISKQNRGKIENTKINLLTKEEDHISNITNNPINGSREMTIRRINKVRELQARKKETASKRRTATIGHSLATMFQWGALAAAVCVPATGWVSALALGAKYFSEKSKVEISAEDDKLAARINNLNLDLEVTNIKQPSPRAAAQTHDELTKVNDKTTQMNKGKTTNQRIVDEYVDMLDGIGENTPAKQLVK